MYLSVAQETVAVDGTIWPIEATERCGRDVLSVARRGSKSNHIRFRVVGYFKLLRLKLHQDSSYTSHVSGYGSGRDGLAVECRRFGSPLESLRAAEGGKSSMNRKKSAMFTIRTHRGRPRFSIPRVIRDQIGIHGSTPSGPGDAVKLVVDSETGHYKGSALLRSGSEIYGPESISSGIRKNQRITVKISK